MKRIRMERIAILVTVVGMISAVAWPLIHEGKSVKDHAGAGVRVITITGVAATGTWTDAEVRGGNYFARDFPQARPVLREGERILFRFKSADVVHRFYAPEVGIGPVDVYPGHVAEVEVTPTTAGVFDYYCTMMCGKPHFKMRGLVVVQPAADPSASGEGRYWLEPQPESTRLVDRGAWLFHTNGCFTCHGESGHGGVRNPNYVKESVPALDTLAERMYLFYPEDVAAVVGALEERIPLDHLVDEPPVPRYRAVLAKYQAVSDLIRRGNPAGRKHAEGPAPPLNMPTWGQRLSDLDIDALIAYLLTLEPVERG
jgi:mono/diheme cytochrome c family protein